MDSIITKIIKDRNPKNVDETKAIIREILQNIVLIGLSRAGFFKIASFYGGTALRIFYGLNRYSEDLDFTLNSEKKDFSFEEYAKSIREVAFANGLSLEINVKNKSVESRIESAFAKINTYQTFVELNIDENLNKILHKDEVLKVKFEVDCFPPQGFNIESHWITSPDFASVNVLDMPSLFAGKLAAILCRNYKNTVKGRDYYDFLFFIKNNIHPNLTYLRNKLLENNFIKESDEFDIDVLKNMLINRFNTVDFSLVTRDAEKFLFNNENLSYYCKELFIDCVRKL